MSNVFVVDANKQPLNAIHPGEARFLLNKGKAAVLRMHPFTIILKVAIDDPTVTELRIKIDPGSKTTGIAIVNDQSGEVVFAAELTHRGQQVTSNLDNRRGVRRGRRNRHTRYRQPRCAPCHAAMYSPYRGEELEGRFLGHPSHLELKSEGDHSMMGKRGTSRDVADESYPQDPRRMVKAKLLEP